MREDVQLGAVAVDVVDVEDTTTDSAETARAQRLNRVTDTQKGVTFIIGASVFCRE